MKRLIKAVVPAPVISAALDMRDAARLCAAGRKRFDHAHLLPAGVLDTDFIFGGGAFEKGWQADHEAIKDIFGDGGRSGGVNPGDRRALYYLVRALNPQTVLEVGTHIGASTLYIARALKASGKQGRVTTVDILDVNAPEGPWKKAEMEMPPRGFAEKLECGEFIEFMAFPSLDFMNGTDKGFDFIFLDGDHGARTVYREVAAALKILNPGGVILLHDFYPEGRALFPDDNIIRGPFRALSRIARENPAISARPLGNLPWETKQGVNVTSLALLSRNSSAVSS
ncbi:MAG: class I SAM-dependent methyltransferase [Proteobacteria bacterium]|nr:class I SAM-dependent methyltransferase [Pseudomonadota bacterium]